MYMRATGRKSTTRKQSYGKNLIQLLEIDAKGGWWWKFGVKNVPGGVGRQAGRAAREGNSRGTGGVGYLLGIGDILLSFCLKSGVVDVLGHNLLKHGDKRCPKSMKSIKFSAVKMLKAEKNMLKKVCFWTKVFIFAKIILTPAVRVIWITWQFNHLYLSMSN